MTGWWIEFGQFSRGGLSEKHTPRGLKRPVQPFLGEVEFDLSPDSLLNHTFYHNVSKALLLGGGH